MGIRWALPDLRLVEFSDDGEWSQAMVREEVPRFDDVVSDFQVREIICANLSRRAAEHGFCEYRDLTFETLVNYASMKKTIIGRCQMR